MNKHEFLKPALTGLAIHQLALKVKGGPSENGELFEQILEVQEKLLQSFGLPFSPANQQLEFFDSFPTETEVEDRIAQLHQTAASYLLGTTKSELQTLREAQEM